MCTNVELMYSIVTSIEFWMSLIISNLIVELKNLKPMNVLKTIIVGVGAIVWGHSNMTCRILCKETAHQDNSDGGSIPPPHSLILT